MSKQLYIALDTETGGLDMDCSLLSASFEIFDDSFAVVDYLDLYLKPKDGIYKVQAEAMAINKINLVEHDKIAITYEAGGTKLYEFLQKNIYSNEKATPVGHGIAFDIPWIRKYLVSRGSWEKYCSHRHIDTGVVARFLNLCGRLTMNSGSLEELKKLFEITTIDDMHTAKGDTTATRLLLQELVECSKVSFEM